MGIKVGDHIRDRDNTLGRVIEVKDDWVRYECRPYACLANIICNPKHAMRVRRFWNMRRNVVKVEKDER